MSNIVLSLLWWQSLSLVSVINTAFIGYYMYNNSKLPDNQKNLLSYSFIYTVVCNKIILARKDVN